MFAALLTLGLAGGLLAAAPGGDGLLQPQGEAYYAKLDRNVAQHGWACVFVGDDKKRGFAYTVGLSAKHLPELLINTGEDSKVSCTMLNVVAKKIIAHGAPVPDEYEPLGAMHGRLLNIYPKEFLDKCLFAGVWAFRHKTADGFTGMQIVFPDKNGRYPE